ncbi:hypothetical protein CR513_44692, partial [Mucuna pruriens]
MLLSCMNTLLFLHLCTKPLRSNLKLEGMKRKPTLQQAPTRRVRKGKKKNSLRKGTKVPRKGMHPSKATKKREVIRSGEETSTLGSEGGYLSEVPYEGDLLMVRRLMSAFIIDDKSQRKNIFHSRCMWLSEHEEMIVDKQVPIALTLGKYRDEILCDVVPMEATHVLLGRPWQFDRTVTHDGVTNKFSFVHKGNKITLKLLTPRKVIEDQIKMKKKR